MTRSISKSCALEGCNNNGQIVRDYCRTHYAQLYRRGYVKLDTRLTANTYRNQGNLTYIGLRNNDGVITSEAIIDTKNIDKVKVIKWYRKEGRYVYGIKDGKRYYLHRVVADCPKGRVINHWDHNELNCTETNLVICEQWENAAYKRKTRGRYPYKGIYYKDDCVKKWRTRATIQTTHIDIGLLNDMEEAAWIYDQIVMQLCGDFAYTNFEW